MTDEPEGEQRHLGGKVARNWGLRRPQFEGDRAPTDPALAGRAGALPEGGPSTRLVPQVEEGGASPLGVSGRIGRPLGESGELPLYVAHSFGLPSVTPSPVGTMIYTLLTIGVEEHAIGNQRLPLNLVLVLDHSLSMRGEKLERAKDAARYVVERLTPQDTLAIVSFSDRATVVAPMQPVGDGSALKEALAGIQPQGGTELAAGIRAGLAQCQPRTRQRGAIASMLMLTDGRTYGDEAACLELAEQASLNQVSITPLGLGDEWNEDLLEAVAFRSGSSSEYVVDPNTVVEAFRTHVELLQTTYARGATLRVETPQQVRLAAFHRTRPRLGRVDLLTGAGAREQTFYLGTLHSGEEQDFLIEFVAETPEEGVLRLARLHLAFEAVNRPGQLRVGYDLTIPVSLARPANPFTTSVRLAVEKVVACKLEQKAWQELAEGNIAAASERLRLVATRLGEAGEVDLARTVAAEADSLARTGHATAAGTKSIKYGTRGLGRTQAMAQRSRSLHREKSE